MKNASWPVEEALKLVNIWGTLESITKDIMEGVLTKNNVRLCNIVPLGVAKETICKQKVGVG